MISSKKRRALGLLQILEPHDFRGVSRYLTTGGVELKRVLISSACLSPERSYDVGIWKKRPNAFSINAPMTEHFGLRFLKANHPELTILEYPTRELYREYLKQRWDAIGISFYINETNEACEMAQLARAAGVPEVWAGNYGAMTKDVAGHFDKVFLGWGELPIAQELGKPPADLIHPDTYMHVTWRGIHVQTWGILFTSRGCNKTCTFCQTPKFYRQPYILDIAALRPVLAKYRDRNVSQVIILDENFGHFEDYTDEVIDLIHSFGLKWNAMTRVETLCKHYEKWKQRGLCGVSIGLESFNQESLDGARKGNDINQRREILRRLFRDDMLVQTFYIIGFEQDTEASIRRDISELKSYHVDAPQIQILTPQPETLLFRHIETTYGILTYDYSLYDTTTLVWKHPSISPRRMRELMFWANDQLFCPSNSFRTATKILRQAVRAYFGGVSFSAPLWAGNIDLKSISRRELVKYGTQRDARDYSIPGFDEQVSSIKDCLPNHNDKSYELIQLEATKKPCPSLPLRARK